MRVLSLIPAFLLAVTSVVVAAPAATPSAPVPSCAPTSVPSSGGSSSGNDAPLQPIISILVKATTELQPYSDQLSSCNDNGPDVNTVSSITAEITAVISDTVSELKAQAQVDLNGLDLSNLCVTIYGLLCLILTILNTLVAIIVKLGVNAVGTIQTVVCNLLNAVTDLTGCLKIFVVASLSGVLGPVISMVCGLVDLLLCIVNDLNVLVGVNGN